MDIEQRPPDQPNFKLIVLLFFVAIVVILVAATVFLYVRGKEKARHPSSNNATLTFASPATERNL